MVVEFKHCSTEFLKTYRRKVKIKFWAVLIAIVIWLSACVAGGILCACSVLPHGIAVLFVVAPILAIWPAYVLFTYRGDIEYVEAILEDRQCSGVNR